ncbi:hypothetical protein CEXT_357011 [Caerostris extrusa]|uniref:Uncharacterized protein n=1 Tax=Caerostris extrusa TaxID=172846 RepID=A0AAV4RFP4_CAEEX|nr:hypothetical protein CEXT_357011 [Caerostris extrusa]
MAVDEAEGEDRKSGLGLVDGGDAKGARLPLQGAAQEEADRESGGEEGAQDEKGPVALQVVEAYAREHAAQAGTCPKKKEELIKTKNGNDMTEWIRFVLKKYVLQNTLGMNYITLL